MHSFKDQTVMKPGLTLQCWGHRLHYSVDCKRIQRTIPIKYGKLAAKYPSIYGYFVQCTTQRTEGTDWSCTEDHPGHPSDT